MRNLVPTIAIYLLDCWVLLSINCGFRIINMYPPGQIPLNLSTVLMYNSFVFSLVSDGYLVEEICKQSDECVAWFLFTAYNKMGEERDTLEELFSKQEP